MKLSDIMRDIADLIDQKTGQAAGIDPAAASRTQQRMTPAEVEKPEDVEGAVMVPPLQAKLEILKKSEGIPSVYDDDCEDDHQLVAIKKNAGITTAKQEASDDEPLDY